MIVIVMLIISKLSAKAILSMAIYCRTWLTARAQRHGSTARSFLETSSIDFACLPSMQPQNFSFSPSLAIARHDRWQVHQRLTDLNIASTCLLDGRLNVEICSPLALIQLHSVLFQLTASRQSLVDWLEQCWDSIS
jgi:hypothetical protein